MTTMKKQFLSILKITLLATVLSFGISYAIAWTAPTTPPPGGNVYAPINVGPDKQTKVGGDFCVSIAGIEKCLGNTQLALPVVAFTPLPSIVQEGGTATLSWPPILNATTCSVYNPGNVVIKVLTPSEITSGGSVSTGAITSGQLNSPTAFQLYTYKLSCTGLGGPSSQNAVVKVLAPYSTGTTYTNGTSGLVAVPEGVTKLTFEASGGKGGNGWPWGGACGAYNGGGGGAFAKAGSTLILFVGGGGGGGDGFGGYGGTTVSGNGAGEGALVYWSNTTAGANGTAGAGGKGGSGLGVYVPLSLPVNTIGGSAGTGDNKGANGASHPYTGGTGGSGGEATLGGANGGATGSSCAGGGGGGYGGGGGGGAFDDYGGAGGGGGSYFHPQISPPIGTNAPGGRSILLSDLGITSPTNIYLGSGLMGISAVGWRNPAASGTITMKW